VTSVLSPDAIAAIDDLELTARLVVEGLRSGGHRSPFHGYSAEFQQHRAYRAGDDLKYLDWKILARTDRLYSRQFRETTSMSVMLVLDSSASMAFPETGMSKFRYGVVIAASLAYLISSQGDAVGLMSMSGDALTYVPARGGRPHLQLVFAQLDRLTPVGTWQPRRAIARGAELLKRRGMIIVISDFYDDEAGTSRELRRVVRRGHDAAMLQVISAEEREFRYSGSIEMEDLETGHRQVADADAARQEYGDAMAAFLERSRNDARREGIAHALMSTQDPPGHALRSFLLQTRSRT
jgi:uncharacterized protein (DUF58 family)